MARTYIRVIHKVCWRSKDPSVKDLIHTLFVDKDEAVDFCDYVRKEIDEGAIVTEGSLFGWLPDEQAA